MNPRQTAFYRQARSDWSVFRHFHDDLPAGTFPTCHELHYLQMCTEKLSKAYYQTSLGTRHAAFRRFLTDLQRNPIACAPLGFDSIADLSRWAASVKSIIDGIEDLAPQLADQKRLPNPEYPWPYASPTIAPVDYPFTLEIYDKLVAQASCGEPAFLSVLEKMVATMQSEAWHL